MPRLNLRQGRGLGALLLLVPVVAVAQATPCAKEVMLFTNGNGGGVQSAPTQPTRVQLTEPARLTYLMAYHWNDGRGQPPGTIGLQRSDGATFGPWQAASAPGQGGVPNAYWFVRPDVVLLPGTYTVLDSHPASWAQNSQSGGRGMVELKGCASQGSGGATAVPVPNAGAQGTPTAALRWLAGTTAVFKNTMNDLFLTATFTDSGVSVVCETPAGRGRRTFTANLARTPMRGGIVAGQASFQGETTGDVAVSFDTRGEWANAIWRARGQAPQWSRWIRVEAVGVTRPALDLGGAP